MTPPQIGRALRDAVTNRCPKFIPTLNRWVDAVSAALGLIGYAKRIDDPSARPPPPNSPPPDSTADDLESVPG